VVRSGKNIPYDPKQTAAELLDLVLSTKPKFLWYELDAVCRDHGHVAVRLSPYHCQCDLVELIRAQVKLEVAHENASLGFQMFVMNSAVDNIIKSVFKHTENLKDVEFRSEPPRDITMEPVVNTRQ
jgi:hypothetical protein